MNIVDLILSDTTHIASACNRHDAPAWCLLLAGPKHDPDCRQAGGKFHASKPTNERPASRDEPRWQAVRRCQSYDRDNHDETKEMTLALCPDPTEPHKTSRLHTTLQDPSSLHDVEEQATSTAFDRVANFYLLAWMMVEPLSASAALAP
ncbi:hypothetical protein [Consotaella aegiceratis]|uniref:hypothetical protein n=1 Tax=Consotaella aegiceratis TaxID=3097961 RepID=UPI002F414742